MAIEIAATQTFVRLRGLGYNGVANPGFGMKVQQRKTCDRALIHTTCRGGREE